MPVGGGPPSRGWRIRSRVFGASRDLPADESTSRSHGGDSLPFYYLTGRRRRLSAIGCLRSRKSASTSVFENEPTLRDERQAITGVLSASEEGRPLG